MEHLNNGSFDNVSLEFYRDLFLSLDPSKEGEGSCYYCFQPHGL